MMYGQFQKPREVRQIEKASRNKCTSPPETPEVEMNGAAGNQHGPIQEGTGLGMSTSASVWGNVAAAAATTWVVPIARLYHPQQVNDRQRDGQCSRGMRPTHPIIKVGTGLGWSTLTSASQLQLRGTKVDSIARLYHTPRSQH